MLAATHEWSSSHQITLLHAQSYQQQLATNYYYYNSDDDQVIKEEEEGQEGEENREDKEDAAEGLETGSPTWWASQVIWRRDCWGVCVNKKHHGRMHQWFLSSPGEQC